MAEALAMAVLGEKHHLAKPMQGFGSGVFEIAKPYRKDAYRAVYAVQLGDLLFVLHAFQKKSTSGVQMQKRDTELIRSRINRAREYENERKRGSRRR